MSEQHSAVEVAIDTGVACGTASIRRDGETLVLETPSEQWAYAVAFALPHLAPPWVAEVTLAAETGRIGAGCVNADLTRYVSGELFSDASEGTVCRRVLVDAEGARHLVLRNGAR